jgi:hypothetical protein
MKSFLEVICGALIALHVAERLPELVSSLGEQFPVWMNSLTITKTPPAIVSLLLLASALACEVFHWLEIRCLLDEQGTVNKLMVEKRTVSLPEARRCYRADWGQKSRRGAGPRRIPRRG